MSGRNKSSEMAAEAEYAAVGEEHLDEAERGNAGSPTVEEDQGCNGSPRSDEEQPWMRRSPLLAGAAFAFVGACLALASCQSVRLARAASPRSSLHQADATLVQQDWSLGEAVSRLQAAAGQAPQYVDKLQNFSQVAQERIPQRLAELENMTRDVKASGTSADTVFVGGLGLVNHLKDMFSQNNMSVIMRSPQEAFSSSGGRRPGTYAGYTPTEFVSDDIAVDYVWKAIPEPEEATGTGVYASMQYGFTGGPGGYMGMQVLRAGAIDVLGMRVMESRGQTQVIFAVWDADPLHKVTFREGYNCGRFHGEGTGGHCSLKVKIKKEFPYTVRAFISKRTPQGNEFTAEVTDVTEGWTKTIGTLVLPNLEGYQGFGSIKQGENSAFLEYFMGAGDCEVQPRSSVAFYGPFFAGRTAIPPQAFAAFSEECPYNDVSSCVPDDDCGSPRVLLTAGGRTPRGAKTHEELWSATGAQTT